MPKTLSPALFHQEVERRLIDTFDLMLLLGLRSKPGVWDRVRSGKLPAPVFVIPNGVALWDRDALDLPDTKEESTA